MPEFPGPDDRNALAADCRRCPALVEHRTRISWGNGPRDADLFVVGEAPAAGDPDADRWQGGNHTGMAYTSRRSGRKVRQLVADLDYGDAYYTNAVKCFPADTASSTEASDHEPTDNREPTAREREHCRPYLVSEIDAVAPTVVLATGKHATQSVLAAEGRSIDGGFLDAVLDPITLSGLATTLVPVLHPSYEEVWRSRLGYDDRERYVSAVRSALP